MKVLISAIACNPFGVSELYFGWSAVKTIARDHELWVITSGRNRSDLERAAAQGLIPPNVHFSYVDCIRPWHPNRMLARLQSWRDYVRFSKALLPLARQLHQSEKFDLVHHVTYATWRVPSPLWQLGVPFVFGPIGGNELFPLRIFPILSPAGAAFELLRKVSNLVSRRTPAVRQSVRGAAQVIVATTETMELVGALRGSSRDITRLLPGFYSEAQVKTYSRFVPDKKIDGPLRIFASGNLGGHKGISLALQALARVKQRGGKFSYHLGAKGPEIPHLKRLAANLDLSQEVVFGDTMSRADYEQTLGDSHLYLLPSMRESVGLTMMEAMLAGCVPIVANCGGPNFIVTEDCGFRITVSSRKQMVEDMANIILAIDRDRNIILVKGKLASKRIATSFTDENYHRTVNGVYASVVQRHRGQAGQTILTGNIPDTHVFKPR